MTANEKLNHCMDSLINQTINDYEIIAVDDCSTDNSLEVLREYEARYPDKVRVIESKVNAKQGGARNKGLKAALGKWVGFMDSDDWAHPTMFEKLVNRAEETGADFCGCDYSLVDEYTMTPGTPVNNNTDDQTGILDETKHASHFLGNGSMVVKIYLRSVIEENGLDFPEGIFYEDNCAAPYWSLYFTHFEYVKESLYYYLTVAESTTHHVSWDKCLHRMEALDILLNRLKGTEEYDKYYKELEYRYTHLYYENTLFSYMQNAKHPKLGHVKQLKAGIMKAFPNYDSNEYYKTKTSDEHMKLMAKLKKGTLGFYLYYRLMRAYRKMR